MGLLSIFKRRAEAPPTPAAASDTSEAVLRARTRARQRLIGAAVLVVIGIIGFPLVFETQPRPIPVDIPIEIAAPGRRAGAGDAAAACRPRRPAASRGVAGCATGCIRGRCAADAERGDHRIARRGGPRSRWQRRPPRRPAMRRVAPAARSDVEAAREPASATVADAPPPSADRQPAPGRASTDGARAHALLDGKPAAGAGEQARFVVQVGAFADAGRGARDAPEGREARPEDLHPGRETTAGNRIRVRVGPFGTRDEAEQGARQGPRPRA